MLERSIAQPPDPDADADDVVADRLLLVVEVQPDGPDLNIVPHAPSESFDVWGPPPLRLQADAMLPGPTVIRRRREFFRPQLPLASGSGHRDRR